MKSLLTDISLPFAAVFLCLAGGFFYLARQQDAHARALIGNGQVAIATITDKTSFTSSGVHKYGNFTDKGPTTYTLHYRFTLPDTGETREGDSNVHLEVWNAVQIGSHYQIVFLPSTPAVTSLFDGQDFVDGAQLAYRIAWTCSALGLISAGIFLRLRA